jgi:hypothetical protein
MEGHGQAVNNVACTLEVTGLRLGANTIYHGWGGSLRFPHSLRTSVGIEGVLGTFHKIA